MITFWQILFGWLPAVAQACIFGFVAFIVIMLIIRLVGFILNAIPFL